MIARTALLTAAATALLTTLSSAAPFQAACGCPTGTVPTQTCTEIVPAETLDSMQKPITDLGAAWAGSFVGGLYEDPSTGNHTNTPPPAHRAASLSEAQHILPRNGRGAVTAAGRIGFLSVGISNATHEFGRFERLADQDPYREARVVLLNGGHGGIDSEQMAELDMQGQPVSPYWLWLKQRVHAAGMSKNQVQVAWMETARVCFDGIADSSTRIALLQAEMKTMVRILRQQYPNLRICYLSSRAYAGYKQPSIVQLDEPYAYESAFAVKGLIRAQVEGNDPELDYTAGEAPLLLWGPYFWANGTSVATVKTTNDVDTADIFGAPLTWTDGTCALCTLCVNGDVERDNVHPSPSGEEKVAMLMRHFLATEPSASWYWQECFDSPTNPPFCEGWFQPRKPVAVVATDDTYVQNDPGDPATKDMNFGTQTKLEFGDGFTTFVQFDVSSYQGQFTAAKLSLRRDKRCSSSNRSRLFLVGNQWDESTLTYNLMVSQSLTPSIVVATTPSMSKDGSVSFDVTSEVLQATNGVISFAIQDPDLNEVGAFKSKEFSVQSTGFPDPFTDPPALILDLPSNPLFEDPPTAPL